MGSQVERNFGFHGGETIINNGGHEVKYFYIQSVEPGGTFEKAGLRPNDIPFFNKGCRFFMLYKTDEAILYTGLNYAKNGKQLTFSVINKEEYDKAIKSDMNYYDYIRKISLIISDENSQN